VNDATSRAAGSAAIRCVRVQFVANSGPRSHYAFVPRVGMVAQSMRLLSHVLRRARNRGRHVLVVVAGEPLNSSGPPVVSTSLRDRAARELEKLTDSVVSGPGARRRDFHRSGSVRGPGSRSVGMEVTVSAGPLPTRPRLGRCIGDSLPVTAATTFAISQPPNVIPPGPRLG
jgi:hypothetical protein